MKLSICIPTYNRPGQLPNCLNSICIAKQNSNLNFDVCISDNGSKKFVALDSDNVSASMFEMDLQSVKLSFSDLSYIQGLKPDNETYLCGEPYWTGV